jgi:hypothetical protein
MSKDSPLIGCQVPRAQAETPSSEDPAKVASSRPSKFGRQAIELGGADSKSAEKAAVNRRYLTWHLLGVSWSPRHVACGEWSRL